MASRNFGFLSSHDALFEQLAEAAERNLTADPNTTLIKLRQLAEAFARHAAASAGLLTGPHMTQLEILRALESKGLIEREVASLFHALRRAGNQATHDFVSSRTSALDHLKLARKLAIWFHRTYGAADDVRRFKPGAFRAPEDHTANLRDLEDELARLNAEAEQHRRQADAERARAELEARRRAEAEALRARAEEELEVYSELAEEAEARIVEQRQQFELHLAELQQRNLGASEQSLRVQRVKSLEAGSRLDLDEAETRLLVDAQLRAVGWEADSVHLRHSLGARPEPGRNRAIAEWPTEDGVADYVLFRGLMPLAVVEAKRAATNVASCIEQARRYSIGFRTDDSLDMPRPDSADDSFRGWKASFAGDDGLPARHRIPFLFATNGRAFLRQYEQESGIWFLDARLRTNHPRALVDWYTPHGLAQLFERDEAEADRALANERTDFFGLRDYQLRAIESVEEAIARGRRECLVAMATGTGKTRTVIGLIYRLLKTKRFDTVLFLVDRTTLGEQAFGEFTEARVEETQTFTDVFEVLPPSDAKPRPSTRVHIATVQGLVRRVLHPTEDEDALPVDAYDCIVVDESHRGYTLDRHMGEGEEGMRDFRDYVSTYRRVLDYFDAVKIGLTATPALHTREIFGPPVFTYSYRQAVAENRLVDHDPPISIRTRLRESGITFEQGDEVPVRTGPGQIDLWKVDDQLHFDVETFNRQVITEPFNRVVCDFLAERLEPSSREKTLVFCVNDAHADLVVTLLKKSFEAQWGPVDDATVVKITGASDDPSQLLRRYKNERLPTVAVTVDLLTTGIDVPEICNLVFIRRVRSRILYEQMQGRATRKCDRIGKTAFRIYDAVGLYEAMEPHTEMKPLVRDLSIPVSTLLAELKDPRSFELPSSSDGASHAEDVFHTLSEKVRRRLRRAAGSADSLTDDYEEAVRAVEDALQIEIAALPATLRHHGADGLRELLTTNPVVATVLERLLTTRVTPPEGQYISQHEDEFLGTTLALPDGKKPDDYLESFGRFVSENLNTIPALSVVASRPRALTREQLKELRLTLESHDFRERDLTAAWAQVTNTEIAAGIVGFIRRSALGSPLVPYEQRVDRALQRLLSSRPWTTPQRRWLDLIGRQLKREIVVDRKSLDLDPFRSEGGARYVDRVFEGRTDEVLAALAEAVWEDVG